MASSRPSTSGLVIALVAGVVAVGFAAIFIRLCRAPSLSISAWRLTLASVFSGSWAVARSRRELASLSRRRWLLLAASGAALAFHFATWIASLELTSVASSVSLVATQPIWVALLAWSVLREPLSRRAWLAVAIGTVGSAIIGGADFQLSARALAGDGLAIAGAIFAAIYFAIGRSARATLSLGAYVGVVYGAAAVFLVISAFAAHAPMAGFDRQTWWMLLLLALVPQLIGHSALNWALKYLSAPFVSLTILGEPVISTALAIPLLHETPGMLQVMGGAITLLGVYVAGREELSGSDRPEPAPVE